MNIRTVHICPPIHVRDFDWMAYDPANYDPELSDLPAGWGKTPEEAIADLLRQIEEANDDCA